MTLQVHFRASIPAKHDTLCACGKTKLQWQAADAVRSMMGARATGTKKEKRQNMLPLEHSIYVLKVGSLLHRFDILF
jgi:hypothetical protein